jgi:hypothetical protein
VQGIAGGNVQGSWQGVLVKEEQGTEEQVLQQQPLVHQVLEPQQDQRQWHVGEGPNGQENRDPVPGSAGQGAGVLPAVPVQQHPREQELQPQQQWQQQRGEEEEDEVVQFERGAAIYGLYGHGESCLGRDWGWGVVCTCVPCVCTPAPRGIADLRDDTVHVIWQSSHADEQAHPTSRNSVTRPYTLTA